MAEAPVRSGAAHDTASDVAAEVVVTLAGLDEMATVTVPFRNCRVSTFRTVSVPSRLAMLSTTRTRPPAR
ncbi:unannotated protein [freshwater metagenome]|uniref:Unannotated protein n=1 Tax=freshwater metagenome TaxID=449393 RepID=A0A6J6ZNA0_9ZZZZ